MKTTTLLLTAVLALSAGLGAGFSGKAYAAGNRQCKIDCREIYTDCLYAGDPRYCQYRYELCLADCEVNPY